MIYDKKPVASGRLEAVLSISEKSMKLLWAGAAGRCSFPGCNTELKPEGVPESSAFLIGHMAHIKGDKPKAMRYDPTQSQTDRDDYQNLVLFCPTHHVLVDQEATLDTYTVDLLRNYKQRHESWIRSRTNGARTRTELTREILIMIEENHTAWKQYGPSSVNARSSFPDNDAHKVWLMERLTTIVPNNRRILSLIESQASLFEPNELSVLSEFRIHVRTYESWVLGEVEYSAVRRFPEEFESLIKEVAVACEE